VCRWNSVTGETKRADLDKMVGFVIPCESGGVVAGYDKHIVKLDLDAADPNKFETVLSVDEGNTRFNDAKCDAKGRLWAGTMGHEGNVPGVVPKGLGNLYCIEKDFKPSKQVGNVDLSNGLAWTADNSVMYFIDSVPRKVYAFDFDLEAGTAKNQRTCVEFAEGTMEKFGLPDGMTIDNEGKIWVACFSSSRVWRFDPETGKELMEVKLPATNITSVCWGGSNYDEMYVTCSRYNAPNLDQQPQAGSIFKVTGLGVRGAAPYKFQG